MCIKDLFPLDFFPSTSHYVAYDKKTREVYGWLEFVELDVNDDACVYVHMATTQGGKKQADKPRIQYIGSNLFLRLLKHCTARRIDFIVFTSINPFVMKYGKAFSLNPLKMLKNALTKEKQYKYYYIPLTNKKPNDKMKEYFDDRHLS